MSLSRRHFVQTLGAGAAGLWVGGRGREAAMFGDMEALLAQAPSGSSPLILASNENPLGPGKAVLDSVRAGFGELSRYQVNPVREVTALIAERRGVEPENVLLGSGSTQILRSATQVFTSKTAPLVAPMPAYEECSGYAALVGHPVKTVSLKKDLTMDLDALLGASRGGGLVFYCNPNNPVATAVDGASTRDYIAAVLKASPDTTILVDEAYFEYATMPGYETMIPLALENPRVIVARTFSKCYGMAGLRIGYAIAHPDTITRMRQWDGTGSVNVLGLSAARAAIMRTDEDIAAESRRNTEARAYTMKWFSDRGFTSTDSQTNFIFVDIKQPARGFREACATQGVLVGRDFPPYEKTHCRISIGTMEEMHRATGVFEKALAMAKAA